MSLNALMRYTGKKSLGGIVAFNGSILLSKKNMLKNQKSVQQKTPIFIYGGQKDKIAEPAKIKSTVNFFKSVYSSNFSTYVTFINEKKGRHRFTPVGKRAVAKWFKK